MERKILIIAGPTASGKSARAVEEAQERGGEVISVDSRQVYRMLDIGTEKISREEMRGVPHHLIDIRDPKENYSAGNFVNDATRLIEEISARGKLPILAGGTRFYFDALLNGLPAAVDANPDLREELEKLSTEELAARVASRDPRRSRELDPKNRRRLIRALEIIEAYGTVPPRHPLFWTTGKIRVYRHLYQVEWLIMDSPTAELRERIGGRLKKALRYGLIEEVRKVREYVGDARLNELGLEYKIVGEYLRGERSEESLLPTLSSKLFQLARRQRAWLRKFNAES